MTSTQEDLALAIAAVRHGPGPVRMSRWAQNEGRAAFVENLSRLNGELKKLVRDEAAALATDDVFAVLLDSAMYPQKLRSIKNAPAALFCRGNPDLLRREPSLGVCGSRKAGDTGLRAAATCAEICAHLGLPVVSGYAKGVDTTAHLATLRAEGSTIIVLPEGVTRFRVKSDLRESWSQDRTLVVSQFSPTQTWLASSAMTRNSTIIGLSNALVVVEAGETGGTLAAGKKALELNRRVLTFELSGSPSGNAELRAGGAIPVESRTELAELLDHLRTSGEGFVDDRDIAASAVSRLF